MKIFSHIATKFNYLMLSGIISLLIVLVFFLSWISLSLGYNESVRFSLLEFIKLMDPLALIRQMNLGKSDLVWLVYFFKLSYLIPIGHIVYIVWVAIKGPTRLARSVHGVFLWCSSGYIVMFFLFIIAFSEDMEVSAFVKISYAPYIIILLSLTKLFVVSRRINDWDDLFGR
jgi:hypothetical protein